MEPKISVVIAARNEEDHIINCLKNIPNYENLEVIVVDDASEDRTNQFVKNFNADYDLKIFRNEIPKGNAYSWDLGARKASGELLFLMAADAILNSFEDAVKHFSEPEIVQVHQKVFFGTENNFISKLMPVYQNYANYIPFIKKGARKETGRKETDTCDSHALMRKSFYLEVNPPTNKAAGEEYRFNDIGKDIVKDKGYKLVYEPKFIEKRESKMSLKRFLIQQRWYGRNMLAAYSVFDSKTIRKIFRFSFLSSICLLIISVFYTAPLILLLIILSVIILLIRLFSGIFGMNRENLKYLPFILFLIVIGDIAYCYGFFQSCIYKIFKGRWLINK